MVLPPPAAGRRGDLLAAAARVVADGGLRALTHRAVDATAGVPQGSTSGYFRTRLALLTALTEHVARELAERLGRLEARIDAIPAGLAGSERSDRVVAAVAGFLGEMTEDGGLVRVQAELGIEAMRTPELAGAFDLWRTEFVRLVAQISERVDPVHARERAETAAAAFQGVLLAASLQPAQRRLDWLTTATRQLVAGLTAD